jgi:hypothetical protein
MVSFVPRYRVECMLCRGVCTHFFCPELAAVPEAEARGRFLWGLGLPPSDATAFSAPLLAASVGRDGCSCLGSLLAAPAEDFSAVDRLSWGRGVVDADRGCGVGRAGPLAA